MCAVSLFRVNRASRADCTLIYDDPQKVGNSIGVYSVYIVHTIVSTSFHFEPLEMSKPPRWLSVKIRSLDMLNKPSNLKLQRRATLPTIGSPPATEKDPISSFLV